MPGDILVSEDTINGLEGKVVISVGNKTRVLAEAENITTTYTFEKAQKKVIGRRTALNKVVGAAGTGTMTITYGAAEFADMALQYQNTGKLLKFSLVAENNDQASDRGAIRRAYYGCQIDSVELSKLNSGEAFLTQDIPFTWERFENL